MIVVDTNVIAYLFIPGVHTTSAENALRQDQDWASPLLWRSEFRNVLAGYLRRKLMAFDTALQIMEQAESLLKKLEHSVSSFKVLELVGRSKCSAHDCEFVALAQDLSVPLVTSDNRILNSFPDLTVSLKNFSST
jgi:predicted nucleic acid-binding protein